jgi:hypothetical protein
MRYTVRRGTARLFTGTLAECYERYPTLACVAVGRRTGRGLVVNAE